MKVLSIVVLAVLSVSFQSEAHDTGRYHKHAHKPLKRSVVVVKPPHQHHNTWLAVAAVVGIALALDANGNTVDNNGNQVVVLDTKLHSDTNSQVIQQNGITYILN